MTPFLSCHKNTYQILHEMNFTQRSINNSQIFVFVVCGGAEHIETLHFSLQALRRVSAHPVIVLTDSSRNEIPVAHDTVVDIKTPKEFDHHQASIYLKTGIHKFLPKGNLYCYLDTDVVALDGEVDDIFKQKTPVITFATDHCKVQKFSPHAVNCNCLKENQRLRQELAAILLKYNAQLDIKDPALLEKQRRLIKKFDILKKDKLSYFFITLRFLFTLHKFKLDDDTYFLRWKKIWVDKKGDTILLTKPRSLVSLIEKETAWKWDSTAEKWISPDGHDLDNLICNHLTKYIFDKFSIKVEDQNWQHWNGGVFLFDDDSHAFLESWHTKTLAIFKDSKWKTRDQGTLIATACEFGLQSAQTLPIEFNFLADYNHPTLQYLKGFTFSFNNRSGRIRPHFLHIYHQWGNREWDLWRDVETYVLS